MRRDVWDIEGVRVFQAGSPGIGEPASSRLVSCWVAALVPRKL